MTINYRSRFQSWLPALFDGEFDWDFLLPAWKDTKIQPMDFDAVLERRGHFLIYETKIKGKGVPKGQSITLTEQWKKGATIFQLEGKSAKEITGIACYWEGKYSNPTMIGDLEIKPCNAYDVVFMSRSWFCWASGWPCPTREEWDNELWLWDHEK